VYCNWLGDYYTTTARTDSEDQTSQHDQGATGNGYLDRSLPKLWLANAGVTFVARTRRGANSQLRAIFVSLVPGRAMQGRPIFSCKNLLVEFFPLWGAT